MRSKESFVIKIKDMDCCSTVKMNETNASSLEQISTNEAIPETVLCVRCGSKGRAVPRKTVLLMVNPEFLEHALSGSYSFCAQRDCSVVYFSELGDRHFTLDDVRVRVGLKLKDDPVPLCYCFG